jgi:hydroxymethylglutaryl-CoA lyase
VSETHNLDNAGRTVAASLGELGAIVAAAHDVGAVAEVTLATAFGCPYDGPVAPALVVDAAERSLAHGVDGIAVADTIGTAIPTEVAAVVGAVVARAGDITVGAHLHDTRGLALSNALAAIDAGAGRLDGSVGGLGGCPFAPGASGNVPLEDLVHLLDAMGVQTGAISRPRSGAWLWVLPRRARRRQPHRPPAPASRSSSTPLFSALYAALCAYSSREAGEG